LRVSNSLAVYDSEALGSDQRELGLRSVRIVFDVTWAAKED